MMEKMMKKLVAVMMMSLTLAVPLAQSAEAAGHKHVDGPRQEMRMERHEQRLSKPGGHREQRMERHEPTHGKHQPMSRSLERDEHRGGGRGSNDTAVLLGRLLLGAILSRDI